MKKNSLRSALAAAADVSTAPSPRRPIGAQNAPAWRKGKIHIGGHFDPSFRQRLTLIQAKIPGMRGQQLLEEALEMLFEKHGVVGSGR